MSVSLSVPLSVTVLVPPSPLMYPETAFYLLWRLSYPIQLLKRLNVTSLWTTPDVYLINFILINAYWVGWQCVILAVDYCFCHIKTRMLSLWLCFQPTLALLSPSPGFARPSPLLCCHLTLTLLSALPPLLCCPLHLSAQFPAGSQWQDVPSSLYCPQQGCQHGTWHILHLNSGYLQAFGNMILVIRGISMTTAYAFNQGEAGLLYAPYFTAISPTAIVYSGRPSVCSIQGLSTVVICKLKVLNQTFILDGTEWHIFTHTKKMQPIDSTGLLVG